MATSEILIQDFGGIHNKDLKGSAARLMKGGSWKRQNIVVVIPSAHLIPAKVALALWNLAFPPNNGVVRMLALGMEVGDAYSQAVEQIITHPQLKDFEYLCCIEHDNLPPPDGVVRLVQDMEEYPQYSVIGGSYFTKGIDGVWQGWGDPRDPIQNFRPQIPIPNTVQEVCGTGQGFTLYRMSMFKDPRFPKPFFKTKNGINNEGVGTQDLSFAVEARKLGYKFAVDTRVAVGHYDFEGKFGPPDTTY